MEKDVGSITSSSDTNDDDEIVIFSDNYKYNEEAENEDYKISAIPDINLEHEFDDDEVDEVVDQATYFQKGKPCFHGLTEEKMTLKQQQMERHTVGHCIQ